MSDTSQRRSKSEIDISTRASAPGFGWRGNLLLWGGLGVVLIIVGYLDLSFWWMFVIFPVLIPTLVLWIVWQVVVRRGMFTWMRLAKRPAHLMESGEAEAAERMCKLALERASHFAPDDHRRGMMLCELAMFIRLQGRYAESLTHYEEAVEILGKHQAKNPFDYFVVLNNYGICFIHLKDYEAAQRILEKAIDLTLAARKREANSVVVMPLAQVQAFQFVLHLNLAFLFMEVHDLAEAELQLREADQLEPLLSKQMRKQWHDHYVAMCALWEYEAGHFAEAEVEIDGANNPDYSACLRVRAKLHLVRQEHALAETLLRKHQTAERKKGTLHRPDMVKPMIDLAESLCGQGKHDDAFAAIEEARRIAADFKLPPDQQWRRMLDAWLKRARDLGKSDIAQLLEGELRAIPVQDDQGVMILEKLRVKK